MYARTARLKPEQLRTLLSKVASKDAHAFRELYEETARNLFGVALRIVQRSELAEDVLQESFLSVWNSAGDYRGDLSAPTTWMTTIVRNKAFDVVRESNLSINRNSDDSDTLILDALIDPCASPLEALEASRQTVVIAIHMAQLNSRQRQVISMAFVHDLSHTEISSDLSLPLGTVKTWIRRGLEQLRTGLKRQGMFGFVG